MNGWDKYDLYLEIYTDGACSTNGDWSGGYGMVVMDNNEIVHAERKVISETTNNREELKAMIAALKYVEKYPNIYFTIYTDSTYVLNTCTSWIFNWYNNNWKLASGKDVQNLDLIETLYKYVNKNFSNCQIEKVKGHSGDVGNELADALATGNKAKIEKTILENRLIY